MLAHEAGHVVNGHIDDIDQYRTHRGKFEVEAESTAMIVMTAMGLDTTAWSADYCAGWAKKNPELIQDTASKVVKSANAILDELLPNGIEQGIDDGAELAQS